MADREDNVYRAKLAEQAERYDGKCYFWYLFLPFPDITFRLECKYYDILHSVMYVVNKFAVVSKQCSMLNLYVNIHET